MPSLDIVPQTFKVSDFLGWQRDGSLTLSPNFQRRSVWKPGAKSYLIDTIVRGLPVPTVMIRERLDLEQQRTTREVVDGQQRLRTLIAYIDESCLTDFKQDRDRFTVRATHNAELAGKTFDDLDRESKTRILGYKFSTHVLPPGTEDRDILQMFARLNATGVRLNAQELRNASYFGVFKTLMYTLALEQLERWQEWRIFTPDQIARMSEVELTSDLIVNMIKGLSGKNQRLIESLYLQYDNDFRAERIVSRRFRRVFDTIAELVGNELPQSVFRGQVLFFTLFVFLYDEMYGLGSSLGNQAPERLPRGLNQRLLRLDELFEEDRVPALVMDAVNRAPVDLGRRRTRLNFFRKICNA